MLVLALLVVAPNVQLGPYDAINPQLLVRLVAVLLALTFAAELAQRVLGARLGLTITGFVGGFVSSTATIAMLGAWSKQHPQAYRGAAAGALASNVATIAQYGFIVAVIDPSLLRELSGSLGCAALMALLSSFVTARDQRDGVVPAAFGRGGFGVANALGFALVFSLVSIAARALQEWVGAAGIVVVSMLAAFIDAHSTAGSLASLHLAGDLDAATAELAILLALSANSVTKIAMAFTGGHLKFALTVSVAVVLIAAAAWFGRFAL